MIPLIVLVGSFLLLLAVHGLYKEFAFEWIGRIAFSVMILFTGSSHFYLTEGMVMSMPSFLPAKEALVYFTGALEIIFGLAFILTKRPVMVAQLLIVFLVAVFPAHVYAALHHVDVGLVAGDHRVSPICAASRFRARCRWLRTVFSGIPSISATCS